MGKLSVTPTRSAVNVLIGELCSMSGKEGSVEKVRMRNTCRDAIQLAVAVFWKVVNSGLLPSTFEEAVRVLRIAEERKLTCVEEGYSMVMKALCEHRRVEEAGKLFGRMLDRGIKPKLVVYNSVIFMLCKLGDLENATRVFEIMNKNRCLPDSLTYIALIHAHGECNNWKGAYDLLMEMLGLGWIPKFGTYNLADSLLREHDQLSLCVKLEKGIHLSAYARDSFEHVLQWCGKLKIAHQLLEKTRRVQEPGDIKSLTELS